MFYPLRKLCSRCLRYGIIRFIYFLIIFPWQRVQPIDKKSIVLIGKYGAFGDNVKYLFLYLNKQAKDKVNVTYIIKDRRTYNELKSKGLPVLLHPTLQSLSALIRAAVIVVAGNISDFDNICSAKAYKVQLWHGAGMKKDTSLKKKQIWNYPWINKMYQAATSTVKWNLAVSTSPFYSNIFMEKFNPDTILEAGFPRNDCLFRDASSLELVGSDQRLIERVRQAKDNMMRIVLYAPTFRDTGGDAVADGVLNLKELNDFGRENSIVFVFKMHPKAKTTKEIKELSNIWEYDRHDDIYPMMGMIDLLVTDYSSIFTDYVLLDRPLVFFPYDYEKYLNKDRNIRFDYDWITPGPKCKNQASLQKAIYEALAGEDGSFKIKRREIADLVFLHKDGLASQRIFDFLQNKI